MRQSFGGLGAIGVCLVLFMLSIRMVNFVVSAAAAVLAGAVLLGGFLFLIYAYTKRSRNREGL